MNRIKKLFIIFFAISFASQVLAKDAPASFADLAEKLMPSVVNISTTTTVTTNSNPFPGFQFPPGSPFEDMFKEFAVKLNLDVNKFTSDFNNKKYDMLIQQDIVLGQAVGVAGTPTLFMNGKRMQSRSFNDFKSAIEGIVKLQAQKKAS